MGNGGGCGEGSFHRMEAMGGGNGYSLQAFIYKFLGRKVLEVHRAGQ